MLQCMSPFLAQSGHLDTLNLCLLLGVKRTCCRHALMSAFDTKRTLASPKSRNGTLWNVDSDHSGLMLANLITFAHFATSAVMKV